MKNQLCKNEQVQGIAKFFEETGYTTVSNMIKNGEAGAKENSILALNLWYNNQVEPTFKLIDGEFEEVQKPKHIIDQATNIKANMLKIIKKWL